MSFITGQAITDTTSGYRAVNRKVIEQFSKYYPTDYPEVETIVYIAKNGFKIKEVSVDMKQRMAGKSSITPLKSLYYTIKVTICLLFMKKEGDLYEHISGDGAYCGSVLLRRLPPLPSGNWTFAM